MTNAGSSFTGAVNLNGGLLNIPALPATGNSALGTNTTIGFGGGGIQFGAAFDPSVRTLTFNAGGATFDTNGNQIILANAVGNSGAGGLTKVGNGTHVLGGSNTYQGNTVVNGGALILANANALGTGGASTVTVNSGAALALVGVGGSRPITLNGNGSTIGANGALVNASGSNTYSGALSLGSAPRFRSTTVPSTSPAPPP